MKVTFEIDSEDSELLNNLFSDAIYQCIRMKMDLMSRNCKDSSDDPLSKHMCNFYDEKIAFYENMKKQLNLTNNNSLI